MAQKQNPMWKKFGREIDKQCKDCIFLIENNFRPSELYCLKSPGGIHQSYWQACGLLQRRKKGEK